MIKHVTQTARCIALVLLCALLVLTPAHASAQDDGITWDITPGFDGIVKTGAWFPLAITIANNGPDVSGTLQVRPVAQATTIYSQPIDLPHGANKRVVLPVASHQNNFGDTRYNVTLRDGNTVVKQQRFEINFRPFEDLVLGILSEDSAALPELSNLQRNGPGTTSLVRLTPEGLPDRAEFLQSLDALFVYGADTTKLTEGQREALRLWIIDGGQLVVGGDAQLADGLADLLPATVGNDGGTSSVRGLIEASNWRPSNPEFSAPIVRLEPKAGADVVRGDGDAPILVRQMLGSGSVFQIAFDLKQLNEAGNIAQFWQRMLFHSWRVPPFAALQQNFWALQNVLDLPSLALPSVAGLLLFLLLYILAVGPLNYVLLQRMGRREWAYLSVPLLVLLFSGGAYAWGTAGRGGTTIANQLSFVRVLPDALKGQATTYMFLFSPTRQSYALSVPADTLLTNGIPPWQDQGPALEVTSSGDRNTVPNLLVDVGGVRNVVANSIVDAPLVEATLQTIDGKQQLVVRNRSTQRVEDLGLVRAGGQAQSIGSLEAGEERTVELDLRNGSLDTTIRTTSNGVLKRDAVLRDLAGSYINWGPNAPMNGAFMGDPFGGPMPAQVMPVPGEAFDQTAEDQQGDTQAEQAANERLYLLGWQQRAPVDMTLDGAQSNSAGETLYFWQVGKEQ